MTETYDRRQEEKRLIEEFRQRAKDFCEVTPLPADGTSLSVAEHNAIHVMPDGGAFVEVQLWLPKKK